MKPHIVQKHTFLDLFVGVTSALFDRLPLATLLRFLDLDESYSKSEQNVINRTKICNIYNAHTQMF